MQPRIYQMNSNHVFVTAAVKDNPGSTIDELVAITGQARALFERWLPEVMNVTVIPGPPRARTSSVTFWPIEEAAA